MQEKKHPFLNPDLNMDSPIIVGLDIGTTKVAAFVGKKNAYGKIEILGMGKTDSLGVRRGVVANIDLTIQAIQKALQKASDNSGVDIEEVVVGIAGEHIKSMQYRESLTRSKEDQEREITAEDVSKLISNVYCLTINPGEEIIHVLPQEFMVDQENGIKDPVGFSGMRLEGTFHVITGKVNPIKNIYKCVTRSGYQVSGLYLEPIASAEAVLLPEEKDAGVALVDIGGGTTDLAIFHDGVIRHTAVIPFGGRLITEDIKQAFGLIEAQAEKLKIKFGSVIPEEARKNEIVSITGLANRQPKEVSCFVLSQVIHARMKEILEFVEAEIENSGYRKRLAAGVVITGGGSLLRNLQKLVSFQLGMECRLGTPNMHLAGDNKEYLNPSYATGIGLLMKGIEDEERKMKKEKEQPESSAENESQKKLEKERWSFMNIINNLKNITEDWIKHDLD